MLELNKHIFHKIVIAVGTILNLMEAGLLKSGPKSLA